MYINVYFQENYINVLQYSTKIVIISAKYSPSEKTTIFNLAFFIANLSVTKKLPSSTIDVDKGSLIQTKLS